MDHDYGQCTRLGSGPSHSPALIQLRVGCLPPVHHLRCQRLGQRVHPALVGREHAHSGEAGPRRATGVAAILRSIDMIVSPILSVAVYVPFGLINVFVIDFATFGNSIIVLALSIVPQILHLPEVAAASILSAFRCGVRCLAGRRMFICPNFSEAASMLLTLADTTGPVIF